MAVAAGPSADTGEKTTLRTAAIGVGHFGRFHAQKYRDLAISELVAVCDSNPDRATEVAGELQVPAETDHRALIGRVDAVSIAVPTHAHHAVARDFLQAGVHVLLEKPMTGDIGHAADLISVAERSGAVLQVGHLERFSGVRTVMDEVVSRPLYIEANRISPFRGRGTDVSIVLDLMIHDIDLILGLVAAPVERVDAAGAPVLSSREDIANARLRFANGCVASITASRIATKSERKMRIFQSNAYVAVDFVARSVLIARKTGATNTAGLADITIDQRQVDESDSLRAEIESFLVCILNKTPPKVSGQDGRHALEVADQIGQTLEAHRNFVVAQLAAESADAP